jgi:hypothetical protein
MDHFPDGSGAMTASIMPGDGVRFVSLHNDKIVKLHDDLHGLYNYVTALDSNHRKQIMTRIAELRDEIKTLSDQL